MKVLLVGNYEFDGSMSMKVWADSLLREYLQRGIAAEVIAPKPVFGRLRPSAHGLGKWLGYIDRFLLFPRVLRKAAAQADVVHLCDHGSSVYAFVLGDTPVVVTCHDMLAIRGAMGEVPDCAASRTGRLYQRWIRRGLERTDRVACVSQFTFRDCSRLLSSSKNLAVVLNGLNYPFQQLPTSETDKRLAHLPETNCPFVFHIGSNQARKNREGVLRAFAKVPGNLSLRLVLAGAALDNRLTEIARQLGISERIVQVVRPDVETVEALYNRATVLLFPSRYEGFGWPLIEAQACGCPVVGSDIPPLLEVVGQSGILKAPEDEEGMAEAIVRIATDKDYRESLRERGFENVSSRFALPRMIGDYLSLYGELICEKQR
jgi:glycosyltransferase involved in cell wall biosynthesis